MNTMLSSEVWQDIQGYSGIYQVSTLGRIRSLKKGKIKLLKPYINNMGYAVLSLYANQKQKTYHVHKLVAETFLVKVDGKNYIDHINGIKTDNRLLQELHIKIYVHVVLVGIKQPEIIFGNLINKLKS